MLLSLKGLTSFSFQPPDYVTFYCRRYANLKRTSARHTALNPFQMEDSYASFYGSRALKVPAELLRNE
jgi:hypothetical protein